MHSVNRLKKTIKRFSDDDDGSASVEMVLWFPLVMLVFGLLVNVTMLFYSQNEALRAIQDANRSISIGRFSTPAEVEAYIENRLSALLPNATATATVTVGVVTTSVSYPASDMLMLDVFEQLNKVQMGATAAHLIENWTPPPTTTSTGT